MSELQQMLDTEVESRRQLERTLSEVKAQLAQRCGRIEFLDSALEGAYITVQGLKQQLTAEIRTLKERLAEAKSELDAVIGSCTETEMQAAYAKERLVEARTENDRFRSIGERIVAKVEKKRSEGMAVLAPEPLFEELCEALRTEQQGDVE